MKRTVLSVLLFFYAFSLKLHAQGIIDGLVNSAANQIDKAIEKRVKKSNKKWPEMIQPYRISPQMQKDYKACLEKGKKRCAIDTFSHQGLTMNIGFTGAVPLGDYAQSVKKGAYGFSAGMEYQPANKVPFSFGLNLNWVIASIENSKANLPFTISNGSQNFGVFNIPLKVNVKNNVFNMHGAVRFWLPVKYVQPYFMGLGGFVHATTNVKFYEPNTNVILGIENEGLIFQRSALSSATWSAGGAFGLGINIGYSVNFDLHATYLHSGKMRYYSNAAIKDWQFSYEGNPNDFDNKNVSAKKVEGNPIAAPVFAPIQMVLLTAGITVFFE
jgi:hypothetical protein